MWEHRCGDRGIEITKPQDRKEETKIIPTAPLEFDLSNGEPPSHADIIAEIERNQREISELRAQQASATTETPSSS
ncbi:MAG: hypothetical protein HYW63_04460 [Candidatus Levybacteria bacterium]|nr:hypothetical protein [Candidatus Levybacteria bacterium]